MKRLIYLILVIVFVSSCQKPSMDNILDNKVNSISKSNVIPLIDNIVSKEGRLVFKDKNEFNSTIKTLFDNQKEIKNFESQFSGFTSNKQAFERIDSTFLKSINYDYDLIRDYATLIETPEGKSLERVVDMHLLAYLFNDDGILQIGDSIFKFSYDFTYKYNVDKLLQLKSAKLDLLTNGVIAYPNIRSRIELPSKNLKSAQASVSEFSYYYTSSRFIKCELNRNITVLHNALTVDTKSRRKYLGVGIANTVDELYAGAEGYYSEHGSLSEPIYFWCEDFRSGGVTDVQETIITSESTALNFVPGTTIGTHGYKYSRDFPFEYMKSNTSY